MDDLYWLTDEQIAKRVPCSRSPTASQGSTKCECSAGVSLFKRKGLRRGDGPLPNGPQKMHYIRWKSWCGKGIFAKTLADLVSKDALAAWGSRLRRQLVPVCVESQRDTGVHPRTKTAHDSR